MQRSRLEYALVLVVFTPVLSQALKAAGAFLCIEAAQWKHQANSVDAIVNGHLGDHFTILKPQRLERVEP